MKSLIVTVLLITSIGYCNIFKEGGNIQVQQEVIFKQSKIETEEKSKQENNQENNVTNASISTEEKSKQPSSKSKNQTQKKVKNQTKASSSNNKKATVTEKKSENPKSIKVPVNSNSYVKLDGGYAIGGQTVGIPTDWDY